jgi:3,4-dihydroxy 2-butanone 4-phosphate synthase
MSRSESADAAQAAIDAFARGEPVLIHDAADREGETDIIYPAGSVTPEAVARLRNDAGGLVCVALSDAVAETLELPFMQSVLDHPTSADHELAYDERSSFSLTVNHRDTFTGITDDDRSLTIRELARLAADPDPEAVAESFRSPGHVHLLRAAPDLLADREGHTELGIALAAAADQPPAVVVCEMLDDETGGALSPAEARAYAAEAGLHYVEGRAIIAALE